jgi:hypothetical protein
LRVTRDVRVLLGIKGPFVVGSMEIGSCVLILLVPGRTIPSDCLDKLPVDLISPGLATQVRNTKPYEALS